MLRSVCQQQWCVKTVIDASLAKPSIATDPPWQSVWTDSASTALNWRPTDHHWQLHLHLASPTPLPPFLHPPPFLPCPPYFPPASTSFPSLPAINPCLSFQFMHYSTTPFSTSPSSSVPPFPFLIFSHFHSSPFLPPSTYPLLLLLLFCGSRQTSAAVSQLTASGLRRPLQMPRWRFAEVRGQPCPTYLTTRRRATAGLGQRLTVVGPLSAQPGRRKKGNRKWTKTKD